MFTLKDRTGPERGSNSIGPIHLSGPGWGGHGMRPKYPRGPERSDHSIGSMYTEGPSGVAIDLHAETQQRVRAG
jgi:hypothetical protein